MTDDWRRWIAENVMLGASRDSILHVMAQGGLSPVQSASEIDLACQSPYLRGAERLCNRLSKREWLLAAYRKLNRLRGDSGTIERRHRLSRSEFLDRYYCASRPVIITGMMDDWPALEKWSLDYFAREFGDREVEVQVGRSASDNYEADRDRFRRKMIFSEFIEKVGSSGKNNDIYITASNSSANKAVLPELWDDIIQIPEYLDATSVQNGFFWFGPAGTITPFHHDLTNNFMAQVIGRKRILLAPSWDMPLMRNLSHVYCELDGRAMPPDPRAELREPADFRVRTQPGRDPVLARRERCTSWKRSKSRRPCLLQISRSTTTTTRASTRPIKASEDARDELILHQHHAPTGKLLAFRGPGVHRDRRQAERVF